jgi:uncharacterized protein with HEPN domain
MEKDNLYLGHILKAIVDIESHIQNMDKEICGMRDKLIHDYFGVDLMAVWKTATEDIKNLKDVLSKLTPKKLI